MRPTQFYFDFSSAQEVLLVDCSVVEHVFPAAGAPLPDGVYIVRDSSLVPLDSADDEEDWQGQARAALNAWAHENPY